MAASSTPVDAPLRICMVVPYDLAPRGGGVKQHALHLAAALERCGDRVTVVGPASQPLAEAGQKGFAGVVNIPANGSDNRLGLLVRPHAVWRYFRRQAFDVVHFHEPQAPLLSYWACWAGARRVPQVATFHAYAESEGALWSRKLAGAVLFPWVQRGIAVSQPAARYAAGSWKRPLTIIPNGVALEVFRPAADSPAPRRGPVRLLFVGRLADARKGARLAVQAYAALRARGVEATLDMVGDPSDFEPRPALPGLTLRGELDQDALVAAYQACDVFVAPSTGQESFGIILLEAMASGKPVVCSDIDGYRGTVHGDGARLVPAQNLEALTQALQDVVGLSPAARAAMGAANLAHVQQYGWDVLAGRIRREYTAAVGLHRARH